ncbi:MAG: transposase, partial [Verrucomicrobiales bacterium]
FAPRRLYKELYCARGEMENRIKEQQLDLFSDRTSTSWKASNQLRLWFSTLAQLLVEILRSHALAGTRLAKATTGTIRQELLKCAAAVKVSVRRVYIQMCTSFPRQELWERVYRKITALPARC